MTNSNSTENPIAKQALNASTALFLEVPAPVAESVQAHVKRLVQALADSEAALRILLDAADQSILDMSHDAVIGAPFVARIARDALERQ